MAPREQNGLGAHRPADADEAAALAAILSGLEYRFDVDLSGATAETLHRQVLRRVALAGCARPLDYADRLAVDADEAALLVAECLAGEAGLLRKRDAFATLIDKAVAPLVARLSGEREIRVWVAECGAGEDAYAFAIGLAEAAANFRVMATGADVSALAIAGAGRYALDALGALTPALVERYFDVEGDGARVKDDIRRRVGFHRHDLLRDPPFARIDIVSCRYALAARPAPERARALAAIRSALRPGGALCLGSAESIGDDAEGFEPLDDGSGIFLKSERVASESDDAPLLARRRLRDLDRHNRTVIESLSETLVSWDPASERILFSNAAFAETLDRQGEDLVGRPLAEVLHPEAYRHKQIAMTALKTQTFVTGLVGAPKPSGEIVWRSMRYTRMNDPDGRLVAYLACGRDVSDETRYVEALEALAALETPIDRPVEDFAEEALRIGAGLLGTPYAMLARPDGEGRRIACLVSLDSGCPRTLRDAAFARALETARGATDSARGDAADGALAAYVGFGVRAGSESYGAVAFFSDRPPGFGRITDIQRSFVRHVARWLGLKIEIHRQHLSLRRNEAELRLVFANVAQNIWLLDRWRRVRWANAGAAQAMGLDLDSVVGAPADGFMQRLDPKWRAHAEQAFGAQSPAYGVEARFRQAGAPTQWTSTDFIPNREGSEGEPSLLVVSTDVTVLKERESEFEVAVAEVDHNRRLFERHYRRTPVLLCSFAADGRVVEASDLWRDKTGYGRDDMVGRRLGDFMDEPSRRRAAEEMLPALRRTGACEAVPLRFLGRSGRAMDVELSGYLSAEDGGAPLCLAALTDVTARNAAETALERANRELATVNEGLKKFAHVASHDLQEPLRKIQQFGHLLATEHGQELSGDALSYVDVMRESADRMRRLIRDILVFSRAMNATLSRTRLSLAEIARETLSELDLAVREAGAEVTVGALPGLFGDRTAVQLLMRNLIGNSLKYRRPGVAPRVSIAGAWTGDGEFVLSFRDNGCGVEPRHHEIIFDPFTRLHNRSEVDGSGIGLAICKSVCERQQWRIGVASAGGEGAEFTVAIPAADVLNGPREA